jgi:hypothetical protein
MSRLGADAEERDGLLTLGPMRLENRPTDEVSRRLHSIVMGGKRLPKNRAFRSVQWVCSCEALRGRSIGWTVVSIPGWWAGRPCVAD